MEIGSCWDVWLGHQIPIVECGKTIFLRLACTPQKLNREYQLYLWQICKGDGALPSLPASPIKFVFTLCFSIFWATNLLFGWPTHARMILLRTWTTLCCIFELPPADIKLFCYFRTGQHKGWAMRVSCPVLPRLYLKATDRYRVTATSYLQDFSSRHACGLHSKCLLIASCDQPE